MGTQLKLRCNKCNYEVLTSGGHDYGMMAVTDTFICKSCNNIVDVCVGEHGNTYTKEEALQKREKSGVDIQFYLCPKCGSGTNLVKWNKSKKPCPRCDGKMVKDQKGGIIMLWD